MLLDLIARVRAHRCSDPVPLVRPGAVLRGAPRGRGASQGALHRTARSARPAWPALSSGASRGASGAASSSSRASSCRASGRGDVRARNAVLPDVGPTTSREATTAARLTRSNDMKLMHQELAREHSGRRRLEGEHADARRPSTRTGDGTAGPSMRPVVLASRSPRCEGRASHRAPAPFEQTSSGPGRSPVRGRRVEPRVSWLRSRRSRAATARARPAWAPRRRAGTARRPRRATPGARAGTPAAG